MPMPTKRKKSEQEEADQSPADAACAQDAKKKKKVKVEEASGKVDGRLLLPLETTLAISSASRGDQANEADQPCGDDPAEARTDWVTATIVRAKLKQRASDAGDASAGTDDASPRYRLRFDDGAEKWLSLRNHAFLVHPPSQKASAAEGSAGKSAAEDDPRRLFMAAHCHRPLQEAAQAAKSVKKGLGAPAEQKAWMRLLLQAGSAGDVAELANEHCARFDMMNISIALHRLGRHVAAEGPANGSDATWRAVHSCCRRALNDRLIGYSAQGAANICWALGKMGLRAAAEPRDAVKDESSGEQHDALQKATAELMRLAALKALADFRWAACADWAEVSAWTEDWARTGLWGGWKPQELANLCWAISRAEGRIDVAERELLCAIGQGALVSSWYGFSSQEMANVVSALCSSGLAIPILVKRALNKVSRNVGMFKPQELCLVLQAATKGKIEREVVRPVLLKVLAAATEVNLRGYLSVDLSNLMWCLGVVQGRLEVHVAYKSSEAHAADCQADKAASEFVGLVAARARETLQTWRPAEISTLLNSLSRLDIVDDDLLRAVAEYTRPLLDSAGGTPAATHPIFVSSIAMAFGRSAYVDRALLTTICTLAKDALRQDRRWGRQEVSNVLWAASCQLAPDEVGCADSGALAAAVRALLHAACKRGKKEPRLCVEEGSRAATQFYLTHLALEAAAGSSGDAAEAVWRPADEDVEAWRRSFEGIEGKTERETWLQKRSSFHKRVSGMLERGLLAKLFGKVATLEDEANVHGMRVDILVSSAAGSPLLAIEVDGLSHFTRGVAADAAPRANGMTRLKRWLIKRLAGVEVVSIAGHEWYLGEGTFDERHEEELLTKKLRDAAARRS